MSTTKTATQIAIQRATTTAKTSNKPDDISETNSQVLTHNAIHSDVVVTGTVIWQYNTNLKTEDKNMKERSTLDK